MKIIDLSFMNKPDSPYIILLNTNIKSIFLKYIAESVDDPFIAELDCAKMKTIKDLHKVMSLQMSFPCYYGNNWDALSDCLSDCSWIQAKSFHILLDNPLLLLSEEPRNCFNVFLDILDKSGQEMAKPSYTALDSCDAGPLARPFRAIFLCSESDFTYLDENIKNHHRRILGFENP